jgi:hypothetical protein
MQSIAADSLKAVEIQWHLTCVRFDVWMKEDVFRLRWWFLLILFVIFSYVWWKSVDKSRLFEIVLYMTLISIFALILDELGEELCLWDYPTDIFPLFPPISAVNLACMPIVYALVYQYFNTWKKFIIASILIAAIFSFILEPILVLLGLYQPLTWKYYYGFPIYFALALIAKAVVIGLYSIKERHTNQN